MNTMEKKLYKNIKSFLDKYKIKYETDGNKFIAKTKYGNWDIKPNHENRSKLITIYTRFENPELVEKEKVREFKFNSFSGKLNFHYFTKDMNIMFCDFNYLCSKVA